MKPTEQAAREAAKQIACKIIPLSELESQIHHQLAYNGIQWAISQMQPEWVNVEDRLPENFKAVLVEADFIGESYMAEISTVGCYQKDHWTTDRDNDADKVEIIVNKWMYIPQNPTK